MSDQNSRWISAKDSGRSLGDVLASGEFECLEVVDTLWVGVRIARPASPTSIPASW